VTTTVSTTLPSQQQDTSGEPLYTLSFETADGLKRTNARPARVIEAVGRIVARKADRGEVRNIRVTDAAGEDVTFDFVCFQD
jgi:hypothetical protein